MQDYVSILTDEITKLLTQHSGFFETLGMFLFKSFAVIIVSIFGIEAALASAEGGPGFSWSKFISLLQTLMITYTMLAFYTQPIPGLGISFTHLILDQVTAMVNELNLASVQDIVDTLNQVDSNLPTPGALEFIAVVRFMIIVILIIGAQAVVLYIVMFGYVATGVLILLGPVFIPFKIVPQMDWMFWGWLRSFIQYAFYQVVASAYIFIFGGFLVQLLGGGTAVSTSELGFMFLPRVLILVTFILGTIKVPALTFSLFSGRSGDYVFLRWR